MQTAITTGSGSSIIQIGGDGNSVIVDKPHLTLSRPGRLARTIRRHHDTGKPHQIDVIRAATQSVALVARTADFDSLTKWLNNPTLVSVRVMVGDAGIGKTRLALELIETMTQEGWLAGFLTRAELRRFRAQQNLGEWGWGTPVLAVVDYASASAGYLHEWLKELADNSAWDDDKAAASRPLRLLLLDRHADRDAGWWAKVLGHSNAAGVLEQLADPTPMMVRSIDDSNDRRSILTNTLQSLHSNVRPPAPGDDPDFDRRLAEKTWGGVPLMLMLAAVSAHDAGFGSVLALSSDKLAFTVAETELQRILKVVHGRGVSEKLVPLVKQMIAITMLRQGLGAQAACSAIERESVALGYHVDGGVAVLRDALATALPDGAGGIAKVEPDIVGEALLLAVWPTNDEDKRRALARVHADDPVAVGETVVRICKDYVIRGHRHPMAWLDQICAATNGLGALLRLSQAMPTETVELREIMVDLDTRVVDLAMTLPRTVVGLSLLTTALNSLAVNLSALDQKREALAAIQEAVSILRELAAIRPDAFRANLASSLNSFSNFLADLGQRDDALAAIQEAVKLCRKLAVAHPDAFRPNLASSLNNLSCSLSDLGRHDEALAAIQEAVRLSRELAVARPDAFRPNLAGYLLNLSSRLSDLGRHVQALAPIQEATNIRRDLAAASPDAFRPDLASSLNNLANLLYRLGRHDEVLAPIQEAVDVRRKLAATHPDTFRPDLARSLTNLSQHLARHRLSDKALAAIEEAVELDRELASKRADAFRPHLAGSLTNLSNRLYEQERFDEALVPIQEAVDIRRELATFAPDVFKSDLAESLNNLSALLCKHGRLDDSLLTIQEAVDVRRELAVSYPDRFRPFLARSLTNLSNVLCEHGQLSDALRAIQEAVDIRSELAAAFPDAFRPDLAISINSLSIVLYKIGKKNEALVAIERAIEALREPFLQLPHGYASLMETIVETYREQCEDLGKTPDPSLLTQDLDTLPTTQSRNWTKER